MRYVDILRYDEIGWRDGCCYVNGVNYWMERPELKLRTDTEPDEKDDTDTPVTGDYIRREDASVYISLRASEIRKESKEPYDRAGISADAYDCVAEEMRFVPAVDVEPVRRGRWEEYTHSCYCGVDEYGDPIFKDRIVYYCSNPKCRRKTVIKENFCPNCGADMSFSFKV